MRIHDVMNLILKRTNSDQPDFRNLIRLLDQDLWARYDQRQAEYDKHNEIAFIDTVVLAYSNSESVGCACFKRLDGQSAELKRMYVLPQYRGKGIAFQILKEIEGWVTESGLKTLLLETGNRQPEAISLYQKAGYSVIPNYGPYANLTQSVCMQKSLIKKNL